ncbi:tRNA (guanosine(46)-N7)-methyltransferase TrmB [Sandaracinus amylolyticus]|uniref:tRNA (guanine-N(7)-)-methyltransferase n=1 Tax=Sandaracinus amylolyticus TaxID=927083 RepID=A0A0F6W3A8_9BACT|nr:tRNA (guanosine(46)-N7)-methyltransferase TrmB [Sandaracinus amylolyticus]AKF06406.1 tRNA (guanine46-N7-)-methyltransferase [Sandaracinus amylolyticus]
MTTPPPIRYGLMARTVPDGDVDLRTLVPGEGPLELEIGFGRGRFLMERARAAPGSRIIGMEIKAKWAHLVEERRAREGITNAVALRADARAVLPRCGPDGCLARVFVLFPDPWWKKRHEKRKVVDETFLDHVARLLAPGGELFVESDVEDRAEGMRERIAAQGSFVIEPCEANPYGARSNREVRADEDGLPIYRVLGRKRA